MKAPEKIYLQENTITYCNGEWLPAEWSETMVKDTDIEYIRTDAFIEKACEWLKENLCHYDENYKEIDSGNSLISDFKTYMKGE